METDSNLKPAYTPIKCVVCNGFGSVNWGKAKCHACDGQGYILVPNSIEIDERYKEKNERTKYK